MNVQMDSGTPPEIGQPTLIDDENDTIVNRLTSATLEGVNARVIEVEATFTKGLPGFTIVGQASSDIQESKDRTKAALLTNGFVFPPLRITINLSPTDLPRKSGSHVDLSIALLIALNKTAIDQPDLFVFGELGLDGRVKSSSMLFPLILSLKEQGLIRRAIVPEEALEHLSHIAGVEFYPVATLTEAIALMREGTFEGKRASFDYEAESMVIGGKTYYYERKYPLDFADVKGQTVAKRAALIAAAGMHNFFMEGSPGCGKSMIAKRLGAILPPLSEEEILSVAKHQFLDGETPSFRAKRPERAPHHTATSASIFGGGSTQARIGEVALANYGLLFFDEIPHFSKQILEAMREPLADKAIRISRVGTKVTYQADIMLVAAQNPCACGNLLSKTHACRCSDVEIKRYRNKLSDPFLDRIDLFVVMQEVSHTDKGEVTSAEMHAQVLEAFRRQKERGQPHLNGKLTEEEIEIYCRLDREAEAILHSAVGKFGLSHRSVASLKKTSRTIADLAGNETITKKDMLEALSYRRRR